MFLCLEVAISRSIASLSMDCCCLPQGPFPRETLPIVYLLAYFPIPSALFCDSQGLGRSAVLSSRVF